MICRYYIIIFSMIFSQGLNHNADFYDRLINEINSIDSKNISSSLFDYPPNQTKKDNFYNLYKNNQFKILPVMAIRYSNSNFEMSNNNLIETLWISPGIDIRYNQSKGQGIIEYKSEEFCDLYFIF